MTKTIKVSDETYEKIKEQLQTDEKLDVSKMEDFIGRKFFFRTVTYFVMGKIEKIVGNFFILSTASFIGDTGGFSNFIKTGKLKEVEPVGDWLLNINSIVDGGEWKFDLPTKQQ